MSIDKRWSIFLLAIAACASASAAITITSKRRKRKRAERKLDDKAQLKSWENEGGNLRAEPSSSQPVVK